MNTRSPHVLVTGATGFLGSRVVARLAARGIRTTAADARPDPEVEARLRIECGPQASVTFASLDVSDESAVMRLLGGSPPVTHCIHLAYLMNPEVEKDQRRGAMVNIVGMAIMFEAAAMPGFEAAKKLLQAAAAARASTIVIDAAAVAREVHPREA
jgi:nucleoside-diphosphate-sugar epimerase